MKKNVYSGICAYLLAMIIIINCRSVWLSNPNWLNLNNITYILFILGSITLIGININSINDLNKTILSSVFIFLYFFVYFIFRPIGLTQNIKLLIIVMILIWVMQVKGKNLPLILEAYANLMVFIAVLSVIMWILCSLIKVIPPTGTIPFNWTAVNGVYSFIPTYGHIYFETQDINLPFIGNIIRNTAVFTEAPMASLNFCIAFLLKLNENSYKKDSGISKSQIWLIIAILSTFSTTGYILLILIFFIKWLEADKKYFIYKLIFVIPVLIVAILGINLLIRQRTVYGTMSTNLRFDDYRVGIITFFQNPFLGAGLGNSDALVQNMGNWRIYMTGFSNSITEVLAQGGIYVSLIYAYSFIKGIYYSFKYKALNGFILVFGTLYLFCTTIFSYQYILIALLILFIDFKIYFNHR